MSCQRVPLSSFSFKCDVGANNLKKLLKFKKVKPKLYDVYAVDENNNVKKIGTTTLEPVFKEQDNMPDSIAIKITYL